jgi:hypothetical protein
MNGWWVLGSSPIISTIFEPRDISRSQGLADELVYTRYGARVRANSIISDVRTPCPLLSNEQGGCCGQRRLF